MNTLIGSIFAVMLFAVACAGMTWLDVVAMRVLASLIRSYDASHANEDRPLAIAQYAYVVAQALLAEKRRLEGGGE